MTINEITSRVGELGSAWEQFKQVNDRRLSELEKKNSSDPLTNNQLHKINEAMDGYKDRIFQLETAMSNPIIGGKIIGKSSMQDYEHKAAFCDYVRSGNESVLSGIEKKLLSVGSDPDGGYLVTPHVYATVTKSILETSPMRQVSSVEVISADSLDIIEDTGTAGAGWATSESSSVNESSTPQFNKKNIPVHELFAQPKATQKLIDDASINIEGWLSEKISDIFTKMENEAFVAGDGIGKPRGILSYTNGTSWGEIEQVVSGSSGTFDGDDLINLFYTLKTEYSARASFLMNRATLQAARLLKESTTGQYLWNPGLAAGAADTLLGVPVHEAVDMPAPASGSLSIALGDFKSGYKIVDRKAIKILRDPFTEKPFVKFYTTKRVGGDVVNFEAIKLLKLSS